MQDNGQHNDQDHVVESTQVKQSYGLWQKSLTFFALLLAVLATAGVGWLYRLQQSGHVWRQQQVQQVSQLSQQQQQWRPSMQVLQQQMQKQQTAIASNQQQLMVLARRRADGQQTVVLSELDYMINLASLNAGILNQPMQALRLLDQAQAVITGAHDPSLDMLSQALKVDQKKITAAGQVDVSALIQKLDALVASVNALPSVPSQQAISKPTTTVPSNGNAWHRFWSALKTQFKSLVDVRRVDSPTPALLTPAQNAALQDNIRSKLYQAEWALLHRNQVLWQSSLSQVSTWVNQYFVVDNSRTSDFVASIKKVQGTAMLDVPQHVSTSLQALHQLQVSALSTDSNKALKPPARQPDATKDQHSIQSNTKEKQSLIGASQTKVIQRQPLWQAPTVEIHQAMT